MIGRDCFLHPESKIIITTKDGSLTEKCALFFRKKFPPKHTKHALHGLSGTESLKLLCWHAFGGYDPKKGFENEAISASKYCGGHPLALKTLGCSLNNEDAKTWSDTIKMLVTGDFSELHTKVHKVLQISFDSLPSKNCQELFKHIACFFVGKDRQVTEAILNECGIITSTGIKKLINRCLITIGAKNELKMHQLVQEMGKELVRRESPEKPWKRTRVWNHEESLYLLKEDKGTTKIQGLVLDMKMLEKESLCGPSSVADSEIPNNDMSSTFGIPTHSVPKLSSHFNKNELKTYALRKMDKLILLQLNHVKFEGSYENFPKGLKWLCMHGFKLKYIPSDLPMGSLIDLDMSYSQLTQLWKKPKLLGPLIKFLNLSYSKRLFRVGGFSGLPALERLVLTGCECLVNVCESIGGCNRLVLLDMRYCNKLKKLPSSISKLKNLREIFLDGCKASIRTQSHASSSYFAKVVWKSPKSLLISLPSSLLTLSLKDNNLSNESFPTDFSSLSMLKILFLDGNQIVSLPNCVRTLSRLERLSVARCLKLKSILCPPCTIKFLDAEDCDWLIKIRFPLEITEPPDLHFSYTRSLCKFQGEVKFLCIDDEIICSLGWTNLQHVKDHNVVIWDSGVECLRKKVAVCIVLFLELLVHTYGHTLTCFPGKTVPGWLDHHRNGSSILFTMPCSSMSKRIEGINICFVLTYTVREATCVLVTKVRNVTKDRLWTYKSKIIALSEGDEDMVWLSHWMCGNNELENGDQVSVTILIEEEHVGRVMIKECAVSSVYNNREKEERDPLSYYKSWKHIIGGDLSPFQLPSGEYLLYNIHVSKEM